MNKEWYDGIFQIQKVVAITNLLVLHRENIAYYLPNGTLLPSGSSIKGNPIQQDCQIESSLYLLVFKY